MGVGGRDEESNSTNNWGFLKHMDMNKEAEPLTN